MRKSSVALRLQESLLDEARKVARNEGVALNHFINVAVAEKGMHIGRAFRNVTGILAGSPRHVNDDEMARFNETFQREAGN